MELEVGVIFL